MRGAFNSESVQQEGPSSQFFLFISSHQNPFYLPDINILDVLEQELIHM